MKTLPFIIKQISVISEVYPELDEDFEVPENPVYYPREPQIFALCTDGSLWHGEPQTYRHEYYFHPVKVKFFPKIKRRKKKKVSNAAA